MELIKYGLMSDSINFRRAAEALCAEERAKQHTVLANKIQKLFSQKSRKLFTANLLGNT